ncbi:MAG: Clp protease N-terminal domain-containing protein [Anaerolineales bacterium]
MTNPSYPFTRESQSALDQARRIAEGNKLPFIDSLMLLLTLLQQKNSRVQTLLKSLNVRVDNLAARIVATIKLDVKEILQISDDKPVLSAECEKVLASAFTEMQRVGQNSINEFNLLIGMLQNTDSKAGQILSQYAVTADQARERIAVFKDEQVLPNNVLSKNGFLRRAMHQGISPIFISLVLFTVAMAAFLWLDIGNNPRAFLIAFIIGGWIISVALHEFGHAITAFWGGDESVQDKGYLTLNPLKYSNPVLSVIIPVIMLLLGGIGFPGGAVYINIFALRKPKYRSLVSAAGPIANLLLAMALALPFANFPFFFFFVSVPQKFLMAIAFLSFLQITSIIINLLPIPGLDGFGIIEPFLPREFMGIASFIRPFSFLILYLFVFIDSPISDAFWQSIWEITNLLSPNLAYYANEGLKLFLK